MKNEKVNTLSGINCSSLSACAINGAEKKKRIKIYRLHSMKRAHTYNTQGTKISRKGTHPAGQVPSKRYSSCFDFHSSIIRLKRDFLPTILVDY